jgi:hypothetical protein
MTTERRWVPYARYARDEALARLRDLKDIQVLRGEEFVAALGELLWFTTIGSGARFPDPSLFEWEPNAHAAPAAPLPVKSCSAIHLFCRPGARERYFYLGEILGAIQLQDPRFDGTKCTALLLRPKLPKDVWNALGGYDGFEACLDGESSVVATEAELDSVLATVEAAECGELWLTRYEQDSLALFVTGPQAVLMYLKEPGDTGIMSFNPDFEGDPDEPVEFRNIHGQGTDFLAWMVIPKSAGIGAVREFFCTGGLPTSVTLRPE